MFEKRRCHFTHIFELFARYIYAIIVITASIAFNMAGSIASDKEIVEDVKEASGFVMSADALAVLAVVGVLLLVSLIMLLYCAFKWRYTFVSAEENTLIYESGKFIKKRVAIPFEKINTIDMGRNIFERIVGTCRLKIDTGAYSNRQEKNNAEMNGILAEYGLPYTYPDVEVNASEHISDDEILRRRDMRDTFTECGNGFAHTYHDNRFYFKIDHIMYRGSLDAVAWKRDKSGDSDHYPQVATFVWK